MRPAPLVLAAAVLVACPPAEPDPDPPAEEPASCEHEPRSAPPAIGHHTVGQYVWQAEGVDYAWYKMVSPEAVVPAPDRPAVLQVYPVRDTPEEAIAALDAYLAPLDPSAFDYLVLGEENAWWSGTPEVLDALYGHVKTAYPDAPPVLQWFSPPQTAPQTAVRADGWVVDNYGMSGADLRRAAMKHLVTGRRLFLCIWASNFGDFPYDIAGSREQVDVAAELGLPMLFFAVAGPQGSTSTWWGDSDPETVAWREWYEAVRREAGARDPTRLPAASADASTGAVVPVSGGDDGRWAWSDGFDTAGFLDEADVQGFLNLRWDPDAGALRVEPRPGVVSAGCGTTLRWTRRSETDVSAATATLSGTLDPGTSVTLALSLDGETWAEARATRPGAFSLEVADPGGTGRAPVLRVEATVPRDGDASVLLDAVGLEAAVAAPDPVVRLDPLGGVDAWLEDFRSEDYLARAELENAEAIAWSGGDVSIGSVAGATNRASLTWAFESTAPLAAVTAGIGAQYASRPNWASYNVVEVLDGERAVLATESTVPYDTGTWTGPISVEAELGGATSFFVRWSMVSESGVANPYTNMLDDLTVAATAEP